MNGPVDLEVRLVDLPGPEACGGEVYGAVQVRREVEQITALDGPEMVLRAEFEIVDRDGAADFRGPYVQGRRGDRFVYVSWGTSLDPADFGMFRRAKIILDEIPAALLGATRLRAVVAGTSSDGGPVCARVRPDAISWSAPEPRKGASG